MAQNYDGHLATRSICYGLAAFVIIFGIDLVWHLGARLGWVGERLAADSLEAIALALIAAYLLQLREKRILRQNRQIGYLNHHVRNSLALLKMVEHQLETKQATSVHHAIHRIRSVLEQVSRDEDLSIDERKPGRYIKAA